MGNRSFGTKGHPNGETWTDENGRKRIALYNGTGSAIVRGAPLTIQYNSTLKGLCAHTVPSGAQKNRVVVAAEPIAAAKIGSFYVQGSGVTMTVPAATYAAGIGLKIVTGAVVTSGGATGYTDLEFGVCETLGTNTTSISVTLLGRDVLGTA